MNWIRPARRGAITAYLREEAEAPRVPARVEVERTQRRTETVGDESLSTNSADHVVRVSLASLGAG